MPRDVTPMKPAADFTTRLGSARAPIFHSVNSDGHVPLAVAVEAFCGLSRDAWARTSVPAFAVSAPLSAATVAASLGAQLARPSDATAPAARADPARNDRLDKAPMMFSSPCWR